MAKKKNQPALIDDFAEANAAALSEMMADSITAPAVRLQIINEILDAEKNLTFFQSLFKDELSLAKCPECGHKNHWAIPEDDLNEMGWVTHELDDRVPRHTSIDTCEEYAEACSKKKVTA